MYRTVEECKKIISKYFGRYGNLSQSEAEELEIAYQEIEKIQRSCSHSFIEVTGFSSKTKQCQFCLLDLEDFDFIIF